MNVEQCDMAADHNHLGPLSPPEACYYLCSPFTIIIIFISIKCFG